MEYHGLTYGDVAKVTGKNLKTVQRWVYEGRIPRLSTRECLTELLDVEPKLLWPDLEEPWPADLVRVFAQMNDVPNQLWVRLAKNASSEIDIATGGVLEPNQMMAAVISERVQAGVRVRVCANAPLAGLDVSGVEVRPYQPPAVPIFRCDLSMLVWLRCEAPDLGHLGPVLRLTRSEADGVFDTYAYVFERLWDSAVGDPEQLVLQDG